MRKSSEEETCPGDPCGLHVHGRILGGKQRGPKGIDWRIDLPNAGGVAAWDRVGVRGHHCEV